MHFEAALGSWSMTKFCDVGDEWLCNEGMVFMFVLLSVNMVLILNLVIAILSSVYAYFEGKRLGLYYEVLVSKFCAMEYDERYGSVACAQPPLNLMIFPAQWIIIFPLPDSFLRTYNEILCFLLYLPISAI